MYYYAILLKRTHYRCIKVDLVIHDSRIYQYVYHLSGANAEKRTHFQTLLRCRIFACKPQPLCVLRTKDGGWFYFSITLLLSYSPSNPLKRLTGSDVWWQIFVLAPPLPLYTQCASRNFQRISVLTNYLLSFRIFREIFHRLTRRYTWF